MNAPARDPLAFDFGLGFKSAGERSVGERAERKQLADRLMPYHVSFLDDYMRGVLPHDLTLLGAETGVGKTDLAASIARRSAEDGRQVYYFALEAEPNEIERRTKYGLIARLAAERRLPFLDKLNYVDWYLGRCDGFLGNLDREADMEMRRLYGTLHTYYRGTKFDTEELRRLIVAHQTIADLIVVDHLHYVDIEDDNENRGVRALVKSVRDSALEAGKPVLLVVHLRKAGTMGRRELVPDVERVHGTSDTGKVATAAVMLSRAPFPAREWFHSPTFISIPKFRMGGACRHVAMCNYDIRTRTYDTAYTLGRIEDGGATWTEIDRDRVPPWASRFQWRDGLTTAQARPAVRR